MEKPLLEIKNLKKSYNDIVAVDDVNISIKKNISLGIIGESGCGKTTLAKCILGLKNPDSGQIFFDGTPIFNNKNKVSKKDFPRNQIQMIFQDPFSSLNPRQTIGNIVEEGVKIHLGLKGSDLTKYVVKMLNSCGLDENVYNRFPFQLSGGQRQRVGICRALAINPRIIVCDEPTASLDVSIQAQILNLMKELKEKNDITYIIISHNIGVVQFSCEEIVVMYKGNIVEQGLASDICKKPFHPYTQLLIDSIPKENYDDLENTGEIAYDNSTDEKTAGCKFSNRCKYASEKCFEKMPELEDAQNNRLVACYNYKDLV